MEKQQRRKFSPEIRERAVRMVIEHRGDHASQWAAIVSIAAKIGCTAQTLHNWAVQAERDQGRRAGSTTDERERIKALERENRELRQANEILRKASACYDQRDRYPVLDRLDDVGSLRGEPRQLAYRCDKRLFGSSLF